MPLLPQYELAIHLCGIDFIFDALTKFVLNNEYSSYFTEETAIDLLQYLEYRCQILNIDQNQCKASSSASTSEQR